MIRKFIAPLAAATALTATAGFRLSDPASGRGASGCHFGLSQRHRA